MTAVAKKVVIIGAKPPPRGGVSVYLERKVSSLRSSGAVVEWVNPRDLLKFVLVLLRITFGRGFCYAELHTAHPVAMLLVSLFFARSHMYFYDHNYSERFPRASLWRRVLLRYFLGGVSRVVIVADHLRENYRGLVCLAKVDEFEIEVPYVSPLSDGMNDLAIPSVLVDFLTAHDVVVINAAWKLVDDSESRDLYGIQWSIGSFDAVFESCGRIGFLAIVGEPSGERGAELRGVIGGKSNMLLIEGQVELWPILARGRVVLLRTTSTDGDSLSVREAIELGVPVLASDVVNRPLGACIYKYGCRESFERRLKDLVETAV